MIEKISLFYRVQNTDHLRYAFDVDPLYLKHENQGVMPDFRVRGNILINTYSYKPSSDISILDDQLLHVFKKLSI